MVSSICMNRYSINSSSKSLRSGDFTISNPNAEQMCKDFSDIFLLLVNVDRSIKFSFLNAFIQTYESLDQEKVIANLLKHLKKIKLIADLEEAKKFIRSKVVNIKS